MIWTVIYDDHTVGIVMTDVNNYDLAFEQAREPGHEIVAILKGRHASHCRFPNHKGAQQVFEHWAP
jgi:hypothetical protein